MRRVALLVFATVVVAACGGGGGGGASTSASPKAGGTLNVALESEDRTLDPLGSTQLVERESFYQMYESLVTIDAKLQIHPGLATAWTYTDPKTLQFTLRTAVKFHDGTDFNADAVKFNLDRILKATSSPRKSEMAGLQAVEVKDPQTVILHLKNPDATILAQLVDRAGMMLSPAAIQKGGADFTRNPVGAGTGPFMFVEWKRDDHMTLKKNPNYWQKGLPYLDQIIFRPITDDTARAQGLRTGDIDMTRTIAGKDTPSVKIDSSLIYREIPGLSFAGFAINHSKGVFADKAKVQAVATAVDRSAILKDIAFGVGVVGNGPIPPSSWAYDPNEKVFPATADPVKARGIATGFTFNMKVTNNPDSIKEGTLIKDELSKAGITVNIQVEEFGQLLTETEAQNFDASLIGWSGRIDPDGNMFSWFHTGGGNNDGLYSNPQVDSLLEKARQTSDQTTRKDLYDQAQKILVGDGAYVFLSNGVAQQITSNKVHDYVLVPDDMFRLATVWKG